MGVKGFKAFDKNWQCRGFQYEVGKTYIHDGDIEVCVSGFHFCQKCADCFNSYSFDSNTHVAEVEAIGIVKTDVDKCVTDKIKIIRELSWDEVLTEVNVGIGNSGYKNCGDFNLGHENTGEYNIGDRNAGAYNTGHYNTGSDNVGYRNTGSWNMGNYNSGNWNNTDFSSGFFNTVDQPLIVFNKPLFMSRDKFLRYKGVRIFSERCLCQEWVSSDDMTLKEKEEFPWWAKNGGYTKIIDFKTACKNMWDDLNEEERQAIRDIPNFDADIFEEITGIKA